MLLLHLNPISLKSLAEVMQTCLKNLCSHIKKIPFEHVRLPGIGAIIFCSLVQCATTKRNERNGVVIVKFGHISHLFLNKSMLAGLVVYISWFFANNAEISYELFLNFSEISIYCLHKLFRPTINLFMVRNFSEISSYNTEHIGYLSSIKSKIDNHCSTCIP